MPLPSVLIVLIAGAGHAGHHGMASGGDAGGLAGPALFLVGLLGAVMPCTVQMALVLGSLLSRPDDWSPGASVEGARRGIWLPRLAGFLGGYLGAFLLAAGGAALLVLALGLAVGATFLGLLGGLALAAVGLHALGWIRMPGGGACRGPIGFFLGHPQRGSPSPGHLGASFALYCAGCCGPSAIGSAAILGQGGASLLSVASLVLAYAGGMALPFLLIAGGLAFAARSLQSALRFAPVLVLAGGGLAVLTGSLLVWRSLSGLLPL